MLVLEQAETEEDGDSTPELFILEQAPGARNNAGAAIASTGVGAVGGGTGVRDVGARKELMAAATPSKVRSSGIRVGSRSIVART